MLFKISSLIWLMKLILVSTLLFGCGQKGPLKAPTDEQEPSITADVKTQDTDA